MGPRIWLTLLICLYSERDLELDRNIENLPFALNQVDNLRSNCLGLVVDALHDFDGELVSYFCLLERGDALDRNTRKITYGIHGEARLLV